MTETNTTMTNTNARVQKDAERVNLKARADFREQSKPVLKRVLKNYASTEGWCKDYAKEVFAEALLYMTPDHEALKNWITTTLLPNRDKLIEKGVRSLRIRFDRTLEEFNATDETLTIKQRLKEAFPVRINGRYCAWAAEAHQDAVRTITYWDKQHAPYDQCIHTPESAAVIHLKKATENADATIESFASKLAGKANEKALEAGAGIVGFDWIDGGLNPFQRSVLRVNLEGGKSFMLSTKIIINCSKLGKLFNQFPTRLTK